MWGTFRITNAGGYWKGVWAGYRDKRGYSYMEFVGTGGDGYAGLKLRLHLERLNPDPTTVEPSPATSSNAATEYQVMVAGQRFSLPGHHKLLILWRVPCIPSAFAVSP